MAEKTEKNPKGAGRPTVDVGRTSISVSGKPEQLEQLKKLAGEKNKTVSQFVLEKTGVIKMTLKSYSVNIVTEIKQKGYDLEVSYLNDTDNNTKTNKALVKTLGFLESFDLDRKIGILITSMNNNWSESQNCYIGSGNPSNLYSHFLEDGSNWVTIKEIKDFIFDLMDKE